VADPTNGGLVSCSATVKSVPSAVLELSTAQSPVASGGTFSYTLAYHNGTGSTLTNAQLSLPVPVGASFVSASGGGVLGKDEVVRWTLKSVAAGATGDVSVDLKAPTTSVAHAPLVVATALRDSSGQILTQVSDAKAMDLLKALSYTLTSTTNPAQAGQVAKFTVTVTNHSSATQYVALNYDVPEFTTSSSGYPAGTALSYAIGYVAAGATQSVTLNFTVLSGTQAPPTGSLITLLVTDRANGALVSHTVAVNDKLAMLRSPVGPREKLAWASSWMETPLAAADSSNYRSADSWDVRAGVFRQKCGGGLWITARREPAIGASL
jgi:hypothetical protein